MLAHQRDQLVGRVVGDGRLQQRLERLAVADAVVVGGEAVVGREPGPADRLAELRPEMLGGDRDDGVAVGGRERLVGDDVLDPAPHPVRRIAGGKGEQGGVAVERGLCVQQREVELLAHAVAERALDQRREHGLGGVVARGEVGDRDPDPDRPAVGLAGDRHHPALGLDHEVVGRAVAVGPPLAVAGDVGINQPRVALGQRGVVEVPLVGLAHPEVVQEHVGAVGQPAEGGPARLGREVERDRALVPVDAQVVRRLVGVAVGRGRPATGLVAAVRALDLDHVGAEVAELHPAERTGEHARGVEHGQPVERSGVATRRLGLAGHGRPPRRRGCAGTSPASGRVDKNPRGACRLRPAGTTSPATRRVARGCRRR